MNGSGIESLEFKGNKPSILYLYGGEQHGYVLI